MAFTTMMAAREPMMADDSGDTNAHGAVMATNPASMPLTIMPGSGFLAPVNRSDRVAELGAEDGPSFLTVQQLQLLAADEFPFVDGQLVNTDPISNPVLHSLPQAEGINVNTVHGADASIAAVVSRFAPQVESMEGAAFMYACLISGVPFAQVRAVSNVVERRNRAAWKMPMAIEHLGVTAMRLLEAS